MYQLTPELIEFKRTLRNFINSKIVPQIPALNASGKFPSKIISELGAAGYLNTSFECDPPVQNSCMKTVLVLEEISRALGSLGLILTPHFQGVSLLSKYADESLKKTFLESALQGEHLYAYSITEESGGTNALNLSTTGIKDGDSWIINGQKCWITNAGVADGYFINAQTANSSKRRSMSFFFINKDTPGFHFKEKAHMTGCTNSVMGTIELNNCRIPESCLIGTVNEGYSIMKHSLNQGRLGISAVSIGIAERALELAIDFSKKREYYGRKLHSYQGISFPIADMYSKINSVRNMLYHTASLCESNQSYSVEAASLKLMANEVSIDVCRKSQEIHGAYGLSKDSEIEHCLRDCSMLTTAEGTLSACRMSISSALLNSSLDYFF